MLTVDCSYRSLWHQVRVPNQQRCQRTGEHLLGPQVIITMMIMKINDDNDDQVMRIRQLRKMGFFLGRVPPLQRQRHGPGEKSTKNLLFYLFARRKRWEIRQNCSIKPITYYFNFFGDFFSRHPVSLEQYIMEGRSGTVLESQFKYQLSHLIKSQPAVTRYRTASTSSTFWDPFEAWIFMSL